MTVDDHPGWTGLDDRQLRGDTVTALDRISRADEMAARVPRHSPPITCSVAACNVSISIVISILVLLSCNICIIPVIIGQPR